MNYTEVEAKVREATNDDHWGPTGQQMQEVAQYTFSYESFPEVMGMLWKRMLQDNRTNWRRTYKSLILLHYLVRNGSERVVTSSREHVYDLRTLEKYSFIDETGKDMGVNVRHRAKQLVEFIQDDDRLREERKKAKKNKDKYIGVAADSMTGGFGSGFTGRSAGGPSGGYSDEWNEKKSDFDEDDEAAASPTKRYNDNNDESHIPSKPVSRSPVPAAPAPAPIVKAQSSAAPRTIRTTKLDPNKKIDLGAAANYTGSGTSASAAPAAAATGTAKSNDLLADLFDTDVHPPAGQGTSTTVISNNQTDADDEFADFTAFRSTVPVVTNSNTPFPSTGSKDEFADFTSAFTSGSNVSEPSSLTLGSLSSSSTRTPVPPAPSSINFLADNLLDNNNTFSSIPADIFAHGNESNHFSSLPPLSHNPQEGMHSNPLLSDTSPLGSVTAQQLFSSTLQPTRPGSLLDPMNGLTISNNDGSVTGNNMNSNNTWSNTGVNINVDNLLGNKNEKQVRPSMNQLAASSGQQQRQPAGLLSPSSPLGFGSSRIAPSISPAQQPKAGFLSNSPTPGQNNRNPSLW